MIDAFEARVADMLADRLTGAPEVQGVARASDGLPALEATRAQVRLWVSGARPSTALGDDRAEVRGAPGHQQLHPVLRLEGELVIEIEVARVTSGPPPATQRRALAGALDRVLVALHDSATREGSAFATATDQGFDLDGFRLDRIEPFPDAAADFRKVHLVYAYTGRFWPVQPSVDGVSVKQLPTRIAVLPADVSRRIEARAGGPVIDIPVTLDLRASEGATARLVARLTGASPPGALVGDGSGLPAGSVGYTLTGDGRYHVAYRPPASLARPEEAVVELALARATGAPLIIDTLHVEVTV